MKAIRINQNGDAGVLRLTDIPKPKPESGQVLVRLKAAGINFIDIYMRTGRYPTDLPYTPGFEGSGIVEEIGEGVTEFKPGDRVAYVSSKAYLGSYAEYNRIPASQLIPLPDDISFEQGAAFPLQGMTAHYLLHEFYRIQPGDYVLVHAAAGGVGLLLVEWLKYKGALVIGTVSTPEKAEIARQAGADHLILYNTQDFVVETKKITHGRGVNYIIDGVGKTTFTKDLEAVCDRGHICLFGSSSGPAENLAPNTLQSKCITVSGGSLFNFINTREELLHRAQAVLTGIREEWLTLKIENVLPLEQASEAHRLLEGRKTVGKIILKISD